ncbi:MAG: HAD-IA family hydrolase [Oscillospiraceae bacterium]|nr:HAD-IA family hydrolase [Oscillospiraceae bacterium]
MTFLFDLFFTLVTFEAHVYKHEIERLRITLPQWERAVIESGAYLGHVTEPMALMRDFVRCAGVTISEEELRALCEGRIARVREIMTNVRPEILATLAELGCRGHKLCLVSNADAIDLLPWPGSPLASLFGEAIFSCEVHLQKPDPAIYLLAANRMGVKPEDCVFIGDGGSNELAGAKAVGMRTAQARWFLQREVEGADCKLERVEDILGIV